MAHVERIFDRELLKKHLPWSADGGKSGEIKTYQLPPIFTCTVLGVSVFMYAAECWTLKIKRENERRILAAEMNWLRRLSGKSKLEKRRNEKNQTKIRPNDHIRREDM